MIGGSGCPNGEKYLLADDEEAHVMPGRYKNYMTKVMFLCTQAKPRRGYTANRYWDDKTVIWPIGL
jgi:hypothetical protein